MKSKQELHADATDPTRQALRTLVTRATVSLVQKGSAIWQWVGAQLGVGGEKVTSNAEAFTGIGFYAVPPSSGSPEVIVLNIAGRGTAPIIVAARDEATRAQVANLDAGETAIFTDKAIVYIKADGTVEIRSAGGTAEPLATKLELQLLRAALDTAVIAIGANGAAAVGVAMDLAVAALPTPPAPPKWPFGTKTLKGE